jgi:RNA polymerase sigma factor (sigma-70 family)
VAVGVQGHDDVELVEAARSGDPVAFGRLFDRWFDRTYDVAWRIVRNPDTASEVAQDSFLAAWQQLPTLRQPASFGGWVLRIARNRALNRLERDRRSIPSDDETVTTVLDRHADHDDLAAGVADHDRDQLVWAAAAALGERDASLLDLHLRHELSAAAIADELDTSANNVHQLLHRLRGRLAGAIRSWVLWRDGRARCDELAGVLAGAGITRFGPEAVRVISAHAADCEVCSEAQRAVLAPEALFAAVPIVVAPVALKAQAAAGLMAEGVPLGSAVSRLAPSSSSSGGGGSGSTGGGGPPAGTATPAAGTPASSTTASTATTGTPVTGSAAAASGAPRSLQALRAAASGRRLVVAGAAVTVAVAAAVTAVVLSGGPEERGGDRAAEEADITANGDGSAGRRGGSDGSEGPDPSEISATTTPGISADDEPGNDGAPGDDEDGPGGSGGEGGTSGPVPPGGSSDPGGPDGPGGSDGPGGPGGPGDPGVPPGGTTTTVPGGSPGSTTTTTSTPPDPDADPPDILTFRATVGGRCGALGLGRTVVLVWASVDAESARLGLLGLLGETVDPSGSLDRCVLLGDIYLLTVLGPGGQDSARLEIAL